MKHKIIATLLILLAVILAIWVFLANRAHAPTPEENSVATSTPNQVWNLYKNEKYGFSLSYPYGWKIFEDDRFPVINIYKDGKVPLPFTLHSTGTAIAIFPAGLGTEGPQGTNEQVEISFAGATTSAVNYLLKDGQRWGQFIPIKNPPPTWADYAFIWTGLNVDNQKIACEKEGKEVSMNECGLGLEYEGLIVRTGTIDMSDTATVDAILKTFTFTK